MTRCLNPRWQCLNPRWQISRWLPSSSWVRMNKWSFFCAKWLNPRWQNSRWLPSSSWVRMNELESYWISLSQSQSGERMFLSVSERRWQGVWIQDGSVWIQDGRIQDGCHHQVESEWLSEVLFCAKWLNQRWQNSRWLPSSSWVRMNEFESYWISLSHSQSGGRMFLELIWEKITRWLNPRWQCLNPTWQNSRWLPSSSWVRMNKWIFFVQNGCIQDSRIQVGCNYEIELEWTSEFFLCKMAESKMAEFKMAAIINLGENYMSEVYFCANDWIQDGRIQDGCHHQVKWEWMSLGQIELVWVIVRME